MFMAEIFAPELGQRLSDGSGISQAGFEPLERGNG